MKVVVELIKKIFGFIFRFSGVPFLIRKFICRNKVTIVVYHNPEPDIFKKHIEYFIKRYSIITLDQLVCAIYNKQASDLPENSLIITIDDGFKENKSLLEIFKAYNIYSTIYLCSHIINTKRRFWFKTEFPNTSQLKKTSNEQRLKMLKDTVGYEPIKEYALRQALNLEEIKEMLPYVDFQSHSKFHSVLITYSDKECKKEIEESKYYLERLLNKKIDHFCFPNGDYSNREIEYLKDSGYKSGRTLDIGWNDANSDPYKLKAMGIQDDASINTLCAQICGLYGYLRFLRYGSFNGKHPSFA